MAKKVTTPLLKGYKSKVNLALTGIILRPALAIISIGLVTLCFPGGPYPFLSLVAFVPLFLALRGASYRMGLLIGLVFGPGVWLALTWWVAIGAQNWLGYSTFTSGLIALSIAGYHGLPYTLFCFFHGLLEWDKKTSGMVTAPAALTVFALYFPSILPGTLVHSLYDTPLFIQTADFGGLAFLHYILVLINWLISEMIWRSLNREKKVAVFIQLLVVITMISAYGHWRIGRLHRLEKNAPKESWVRIAAIQPDIPINTDKQGGSQAELASLKRTLEMTRQAFMADPGIQLAVWPEIPLSVDCGINIQSRLGTIGIARESSIPIFLQCVETIENSDTNKKGSLQRIGDRNDAYWRTAPKPAKISGDKVVQVSGKPITLNSAIFINGSGDISDHYRKQRLVPFAEYLPFETRFPFLRKLFSWTLKYSPGEPSSPIEIDNRHKFVPAICYEAVFPKLIRSGVQAGGNIIINMSNDAWFGDTNASLIHLSLSVLRTVENRVPLVRVTNSGVGCFVKASGEIIDGSMTKLHEKRTDTYSLFIPEKRAPYTSWGDFVLYGLAIIFLIDMFLKLAYKVFRPTLF